MQPPTEEPLVWKVARPPRERGVPGTWPTIAALAVGLAATVGVVWFALSWSVLVGDALGWARWMLVLVQGGLWLSAAALCVWQWKHRRSGLWVALTAGVVASVFFVVATFLLVASLPCPSFC
ncbi:hypothetical protein [Curtobacterium sp. SGAir0471]|uniref:hypothetical protein n=1 Tax=Curtobacterium sp. SGAir0471 TaxID=2070337 RepID=UPI0010F92C8A|nr:hypothetical protein [Curtobacterium sp. SGAir0471]